MKESSQHTSVDARASLQAIVSPLPSTRFVDEIWERRSLHVRRDDTGYFACLFGMEDLDHLINESFTNYGIYTIQGQEVFTPALRRPRKTMLGEFYDLFCSGRTIAVRDVQIRWAPVARLVSAVARQSGFPIEADLFAVPPRARNIAAFASDRSLFVLQLGGAATWHVPRNAFHRLVDARGGDAVSGHGWSATLGPGDTLYAACAPGSAAVLPEVETRDEHALYLVLAVQRVTWADLAARAVEVASLRDVELRKALGVGAPLRLADREQMEKTFRELVFQAFASPDWDAARTLLACEQRRRLPVLPDGHFEQLRHVQHVDLDTIVERRPGVTGQLRMFDDLVEFVLPGYSYQVPDKLFLTSLKRPNVDFFKDRSEDGASPQPYKDASVVAQIKVPLRTLDTLLQEYAAGHGSSPFNVLYMNIQGGELDALKGAPRTLESLDFIYLENNYVERYQGLPTVDELDAYLGDFGFEARWGITQPAIGNGFTAYVKNRAGPARRA